MQICYATFPKRPHYALHSVRLSVCELENGKPYTALKRGR